MNEIQETYHVILEKTNIMETGEDGFYSKEVVYRDVKWKLKVCLGGSVLRRILKFSVSSEKTSIHDIWSIFANFELKILKNDGTYYSDSFDLISDATTSFNNFPKTMDFDVFSDPNGEYLINGIARFELHVGIRSALFLEDFTSKSDLSDIVLVVDKRKLHLHKHILAMKSPVFEAMLFGKFAEADKKEIEIKDVVYEHFVEFMYFLYGYCDEVNDKNFEGLITLSDKFDVASIREKCARYIFSVSNKSLTCKLQYAKTFNLQELKEHFLKNMKTSADFKKLSSVACTMDGSTKDDILKDLLDLMNNKTSVFTRLNNFKRRAKIEFELENVSGLNSNGVYSTATEYYGTKWDLYVSNSANSLECYAGTSSDMSNFNVPVNTSFEFRLLKQDGTYLSMNFNKDVDSSFENWGFPLFLKWDDFVNDETYVKEDTAKFELIITDQSLEDSLTFDEFSEESSLSDTVIILPESEKLYVNKKVLSVYSTVFKFMFFDDQKKEENQEDFPLYDVEQKEFSTFLCIIYGYAHEVDELNYDFLLKLADRFDVSIVKKLCENYLLESKFDFSKKFGLADKFQLNRLKYKCIQQIKSISDFKQLENNLFEYRESTKDDLMRKIGEIV